MGENKNTKDFKSSIKASADRTKRAQASTQARTTLLQERRPQPGKPGTADSGQGQRGNRVQRPEQEPPINTGYNRDSRRHWKQWKQWHYATPPPTTGTLNVCKIVVKHIL